MYTNNFNEQTFVRTNGKQVPPTKLFVKLFASVKTIPVFRRFFLLFKYVETFKFSQMVTGLWERPSQKPLWKAFAIICFSVSYAKYRFHFPIEPLPLSILPLSQSAIVILYPSSTPSPPSPPSGVNSWSVAYFGGFDFLCTRFTAAVRPSQSLSNP